MRLIYLSTDELNLALVRTWARRKELAVECPTRVDRGIAGPHDVVLVDVDHVPSEWLEAILSRLGASGEVRAIAAHGYGPYVDELSGRGLTVNPRLCSRALSVFASTAMSSDTAAVQDDSDALTWVNLV